MATLKTISAALKLIDSKKENLKKAFDELQSHSYSLTWSDLDSHFTTLHDSLTQRFHLIESLESTQPNPITDPSSSRAPNAKTTTKVPPFSSKTPTQMAKTRVDPNGDVGSAQFATPRPELKGVCERMDGLGLRKFISEYPIGPDEQSGMRNEIPGALLCAPDPAALVLDAMDEFYKENSLGLKGSKRCCVLLLEEFMRIKANVSVEVRERAKVLAFKWLGKVRNSDMNTFVVLELVHLVAAYGLRSEFNVDDAVELATIDIAENEFVGSIPSWIGHRLSSLVILNLRSNNFHGFIPKELCSLTSLQILDLSHNKLFGSIPRCVNNFSAMTANQNSSYPFSLYDGPWSYGPVPFESELLVIKGKVLEYSTTLRLVNIIDLSKNNLSGEIPKEVTSLRGLQSLNFSFNILTGRILENIGDMVFLESLDFSLNQFSGHIPPSMSKLSFLSKLNLSMNHLTGRIPSSTQLQSLPESSFIGNELCGPPLIDNCTINDAKPDNGKGRSKDSGGREVDWFYVSMAPGFVVGFWVVWGPVLVNRQWRIRYFQFLDRMGYKLSCVVGKAW